MFRRLIWCWTSHKRFVELLWAVLCHFLALNVWFRALTTSQCSKRAYFGDTCPQVCFFKNALKIYEDKKVSICFFRKLLQTCKRARNAFFALKLPALNILKQWSFTTFQEKTPLKQCYFRKWVPQNGKKIRKKMSKLFFGFRFIFILVTVQGGSTRVWRLHERCLWCMYRNTAENW